MGKKTKETIRSLNYAVECVLYYEKFSALPNCNTCGKKDICPHVPKFGEPVRINCFDWKKQKGE